MLITPTIYCAHPRATRGEIFAFVLNDTTGSLDYADSAINNPAGSFAKFGAALDISGSLVLAGAPRQDGAYVLTETNGRGGRGERILALISIALTILTRRVTQHHSCAPCWKPEECVCVGICWLLRSTTSMNMTYTTFAPSDGTRNQVYRHWLCERVPVQCHVTCPGIRDQPGLANGKQFLTLDFWGCEGLSVRLPCLPYCS